MSGSNREGGGFGGDGCGGGLVVVRDVRERVGRTKDDTAPADLDDAGCCFFDVPLVPNM